MAKVPTWARKLLGRPGARIARFFWPSYSWCMRCKWPWSLVDGHTTMVSPTTGCFPLCEDCWAELASAEARLPYYRAAMDMWGWENWPVIEAAVIREASHG
jgi:hypothetical protein